MSQLIQRYANCYRSSADKNKSLSSSDRQSGRVLRLNQAVKAMLGEAALNDRRDRDKWMPNLQFACMQGSTSIIHWILSIRASV